MLYVAIELLYVTVNMFKVLKLGNNGSAVLALSGRIEESDLSDLERALDAEINAANFTLDLQEVRLASREALRFFAMCEAKGIKLKNCPAYIRRWLDTEREKSHEP